MGDPLHALRAQLDAVDQRIVEALAERQRLVVQVSDAKAASTDRLHDPERERDLLTRLVDTGKTMGLDRGFVTRIFREVLEHSVRLQQSRLAQAANLEQRPPRLVVAYQGTETAYSHMAAMRHFGSHEGEVCYVGYPSFAAMLQAVADATVHYAVLPIENTTAGSIHESYDLLASMDLVLVGEEVQRVEHCLLALQPTPLHDLRLVLSHPQALTQCSALLATLPHCRIEAFSDTALAAEKVARDGDPTQAAIASEQAAQRFGLTILQHNIANQRDNFTRMVVVARQPRHYDLRIACKTSLIFAAQQDEGAGALLRCLEVFATYGLSLSKIESRPRQQSPWQYLFFVDFLGNVAEPEVAQALRELEAHTSWLKVLGSYPLRTARSVQPAEPRPALKPSASTASEHSRVERGERTTSAVTIAGLRLGAGTPLIFVAPAATSDEAGALAYARAVKEQGLAGLCIGCFAVPLAELDERLIDAGRAAQLPMLLPVFDSASLQQAAPQADALVLHSTRMHDHALLRQLGLQQKPVLLKRDAHASLDAWLQAAEIILAAGNQQVVLCEHASVRTDAGAPTLDLTAVALLQRRTHLPTVVELRRDLTRATGLLPIARAALAAGAAGLLLELPMPDEGAELVEDELACLLASLRSSAA